MPVILTIEIKKSGAVFIKVPSRSKRTSLELFRCMD